MATGASTDSALRHIEEFGEVSARRLAASLGATVRATRGVLLALKGAGAVESVRRRAGRVTVFYRRRATGAEA